MTRRIEHFTIGATHPWSWLEFIPKFATSRKTTRFYPLRKRTARRLRSNFPGAIDHRTSHFDPPQSSAPYVTSWLVKKNIL